MKIRQVLERGKEARSLVRVVREGLDTPNDFVIGVPVLVGTRWAVFARMDDAIRLDGFEALRLQDITQIENRFRYRSFYVRGLQEMRVRMQALPSLQLDALPGLLRSAQRSFPLLTIERENVNKGAYEIGRLVGASARTCELRLVSASARWVRERARFRTDDITRVGFGGRYEETLAAVLGIGDSLWE